MILFADISQLDVHIHKVLNSTFGSKQKQELLIRSFFRMICNSTDSNCNFKEKLYWLSNTFSIYNVQEVAKIFVVIFGPLVSVNNSQHALPYIAWWDLTDLNFIENGLEDLGVTIHFLYNHVNDSIWNQDCKESNMFLSKLL